MTPERLREIRLTGESLALIHHGGERVGAMLLECVLTIDELQQTVADLRVPMVGQVERE